MDIAEEKVTNQNKSHGESRDTREQQMDYMPYLTVLTGLIVSTLAAIYLAFTESTGVLTPVNDKLSEAITAKYHKKFTKYDIGHMWGVSNWGDILAYKEYSLWFETEMYKLRYRGFDKTNVVHFISKGNRIEVRYEPQDGSHYEEELARLSRMLDYAFERVGREKNAKDSWL